jgi:hypothetical protein
MMLVELVSGALVTTGASLLLVGIIGLVLTRTEEKEEKENEYDVDH